MSAREVASTKNKSDWPQSALSLARHLRFGPGGVRGCSRRSLFCVTRSDCSRESVSKGCGKSPGGWCPPLSSPCDIVKGHFLFCVVQNADHCVKNFAGRCVIL